MDSSSLEQAADFIFEQSLGAGKGSPWDKVMLECYEPEPYDPERNDPRYTSWGKEDMIKLLAIGYDTKHDRRYSIELLTEALPLAQVMYALKRMDGDYSDRDR